MQSPKCVVMRALDAPCSARTVAPVMSVRPSHDPELISDTVQQSPNLLYPPSKSSPVQADGYPGVLRFIECKSRACLSSKAPGLRVRLPT